MEKAITDVEKEVGLTISEYRNMTQAQLKKFSTLVREDNRKNLLEKRINGTYEPDNKRRTNLIKRIVSRPIAKSTRNETNNDNIVAFGVMFEDYICTYPINMYRDNKQATLGSYGGILNFQLLYKAIEEILEVAFDKFGFMLEYMQTFEYLSPTFAMIASAMRSKMPEFNAA